MFRTKLAVYVVAAFGTGTTGALIYLNLLRISPDAAFSINWTASTIFIVVIGGLGTLEGPSSAPSSSSCSASCCPTTGRGP